MKINIKIFSLLLVACVVQQNIKSSEANTNTNNDITQSVNTYISSSSSDQQLTSSKKTLTDLTKNNRQLGVFESFLSKYIKHRDKVTIAEVLAIACVVCKQDPKTALVNAIKYFMYAKGIEWCLLSYGNLSVGVPTSNTTSVVLHTGDQPNSDATYALQECKGKKFSLSLDCLDALSGKNFVELIQQAGTQEYLVAEVTGVSGNNSLADYYCVDAVTLNKRMQPNVLSNILYENEGTYSFSIAFPSKQVHVLDVDYFVVQDSKKEPFRHVGSLTGVCSSGTQEVREQLLTRFVKMLSQEELNNLLGDLRAKIESGKFLDKSNSKAKKNIAKIIILLEAIIPQMQEDKNRLMESYFKKLDTIALLAQVYLISGQDDKAREITSKYPAFAICARIGSVHTKLNSQQS